MKSKIHLVGSAISVTGTCTLACKHCYAMSSPTVNNTFSLNDIKYFISVLKNYGIRQVFLGGGEPLLHPDIDAIIKYAKQYGLLISFSTNGHLLRPDIIERLSNAGLQQSLSISLDGPNESINACTRGKHSFASTLRGMYELNRFGSIIWGVNYVSSRYNVGYALETADLAQRMGASYFNLIRVTATGRGLRFKNDLWITDVEYEREVDSVSNRFKSFGDFYKDIFIFALSEKVKDHARSFFNYSEFEGIPSGISISHNGTVNLTPANIHLGNCYDRKLEYLVELISTPLVSDQYNMWLSNDRTGIHQPVQEDSDL